MIVRLLPALIAGLTATAPAFAQDASALGCWGASGAPGLFDWTASPSLACRDAALGGSGPPQPTAPAQGSVRADAAPPTPQTGAAGDGPSVSFSGNAYVGLGVAF